MRIPSLLCIALLAMALQLRAEQPLPPLPPLTNPATMKLHPGKFVWADIFSNDVTATRRFYEQLFGWKLRWISEPPDPYGIFSAAGYDVAGLAYRDIEGADAYARWVHYLSVADASRTAQVVEQLGGRTLLAHSVADRGEFAIFSSANDVLLGAMTSSSGDPDDVQSMQGQWIWWQLYVWDVDAAVSILKSIAPVEAQRADDSEYGDMLLTSGGYARAGVTALSAGSKEAPTWIGFVRVADATAMAARAKQLGGRVLFETDDGDMAIVGDPGGALVGLVEYTYPDTEDAQ